MNPEREQFLCVGCYYCGPAFWRCERCGKPREALHFRNLNWQLARRELHEAFRMFGDPLFKDMDQFHLYDRMEVYNAKAKENVQRQRMQQKKKL